ncbi:MAG: hypothetical protein QOG21_739 [Actinomycetota bacterium]|jgi:uncharacterized protein with GYD domain|nr:hypothetical protein [Actinomycetota bacterium]
MPKYMIAASYGPEGATGVLKEGGTSRADTIGKLVETMGGSVESFYFAFGKADVYVIVDLPDNTSAAALALAINATSTTHIKTTVLLTPEEVDAATKKSVGYRPPGG